MTTTLRVVVPHLLRLRDWDSSTKQDRWVTAFTTQVERHPNSSRLLHRGRFFRGEQHKDSLGIFTWQIESQSLSCTYPTAVFRTEGEARTLLSARDAMITAALKSHDHTDEAPELILAPALVMLPTIPKCPRLWAGGADIERSTSKRAQIRRRRFVIRERLGASATYSCSLETLDSDEHHVTKHWFCVSLQAAAESGCEALLEEP